MNRLLTFCALFTVIFSNTLFAGTTTEEFPPKPPIPFLSAEEELKTFVLPEGYKMELVLDESTIKEPVLCVFDGNGRMYVAEFRTYMQDIDGTNELTNGGRVSRHESTKGDGVFDKHSVYTDKMLLPRMVLPLDNRVLINETNTNDINVFLDTKGDGVADKKDLFYAGGARGGNLEHQQSGLIWAMDNWMYQAVNAFRLRIKGKEVIMEKTPGNGGQWGACQDNYGKMWWVQGGGEKGPVNFQTPIIYAGIELPDQSPPNYREVWPLVGLADVQGGPGRFRPDTKNLNHFTATAGIEVVRVDRLPTDIRGDLLFGEPVGRLVRRSKIENKEGMTYIHNSEPDMKEFIMSTDPNFRAINFANGPDGCIYIVDMYRGIIQEGNWTKEGSYLRKAIKQYSLDKNAGKGRIWRLTHKDFKPGPQPHMLDETPAQLVEHLAHPNGWWRDTAQKLLVIKGDKSVVPALQQMARTHKDHIARLHALWTLEGLDLIDKAMVVEALKSDIPQIRVAGIRLSEPLLKAGDTALLETVQAMTKDPNPDVVLQVLLTGKYLNWKDFSKFAQVTMSATPFSGVKKVGTALIGSGGGFDKKRFNKEEMARLEHGREIYAELCYSCHGFDGKGMPREGAAPNIVLTKSAPGANSATTLAPPLAGAPDLRDRDTILRVLMSGLGGPIHNKTYDAQMVSMATNDDEWIADVASYIRNAFGNQGTMVSWMDSARVRAEARSRATPWTVEELRPLQNLPLQNRKEWKLTASHNPEALGAMIDGDPATRWDSRKDQVPNMWVQIELPQETEIQTLLMEYQKSNNDYPRGYTVATSADGKTWNKPVASGKGAQGSLELDFTPPLKTKFLRITQTGSQAGLFWSIHELNLFPTALKKTSPAPTKKLLAVTVALNDRSPSIGTAEKVVAELAEKLGQFSVDFIKQPGARPAPTPEVKREATDTDETFKAKQEKFNTAEAERKKNDDKWLENVKKLFAQKMSAEELKKYDGVIFLNTSGELPLPDKQAFVDWVKSGKTFIGIHSAADTLRSFKPYVEMLGGEADGAPWNEAVSLRVVDRKSTLGACFPTRFDISDEIYQFKNCSNEARVLLALDASNDNRPKKDDKGFFDRGSHADKNYPLAWTREFGQGRVFYTSLGQLEEVWKNEKYQQHVLFGIQWGLGLIPLERTHQ